MGSYLQNSRLQVRVLPGAPETGGQRPYSALLSSDDFGSSVERAAKLHPLWRGHKAGQAQGWSRARSVVQLGSLELSLMTRGERFEGSACARRRPVQVRPAQWRLVVCLGSGLSYRTGVRRCSTVGAVELALVGDSAGGSAADRVRP